MTTKKDIESALMRGADTLRDTIDAANYKDYVLPVMFVKYLSDSYTDAVEELSKQYSGIRLERQKKYLPFMVAEGCSFYDLYQQRFADNIGQLMNAAMRQIEADNNQQLAGVLSAVDYNSENALGTREHKNAILRDLLEDFEPLDLRPSAIEVKEGQVPADVIGDAYEYMIGQFASMAGKKAGSFYTPAAVSEIMARIVDVQPGERVYDPTCGSGSLLIKAAKKQNSKEVSIYGQEVNGSSVAMAKMNMYIHEIRDAKIGWGDTLANPVFLDADGNLLLFDAIVANMPFSKDKWASSRFSSTTRWRILPSAAPRNSTPCGATAAIRPFTDRLAIMWSRNAQSPLLAGGTPQSNRWNLSSDASILNSFLPFPEDSPPGLKKICWIL